MLNFIRNLKERLASGNGPIIGIDLGTTNSVAAVMEGDQPRIIEMPEGGRLLPSIVGYAKDGSVLVGKPAYNQQVTNPAKTIYSAKRFIGRDFDQVRKNNGAVKGAAWTVPFIVRPASDSDSAVFEIEGRLVTPEEIGAEVLKKLKVAAEKSIGQTISRAVITVPAYFNERQRQATIQAGTLAGLKVEALINEPTAAALAYGTEIEDDQTIGVYDLGGGTYDFSILRIKDENFEVLSTGGNPNLGGDNFDELIVQDIVATFLKTEGHDLSREPMTMALLKQEAAAAKVALSSMESVTIEKPFIVNTKDLTLNLKYEITRKTFERMISALVESTIDDMQKALESIGMKPQQLDRILLVGGSTRIPLVKAAIKKFHGREPIDNRGVDELVALGAALFGSVIAGESDIELIDVVSLSLGVQEIGDVMSVIIPKDSPLPIGGKFSGVGKFTTVADLQTEAELNLYQGESRKASENYLLGSILVEGIAPMPKGQARITVTYTLDSDGVLHASAVDQDGREQKVTIKTAGALGKREVQRIREEIAMPAEDRQELNQAREALSREVRRVEEMAEETRDQNASKALMVRVTEAEKVLQESIEAKDLIKKAKEVKRIS